LVFPADFPKLVSFDFQFRQLDAMSLYSLSHAVTLRRAIRKDLMSIETFTIQSAANSLHLSRASYYRLVNDGLLPAPIRITPNRSVVIGRELNAVIDARCCGAGDSEIRELVKSMADKRGQANG
jgi:predicted DNA-binding transcriptional regulator AlpA